MILEFLDTHFLYFRQHIQNNINITINNIGNIIAAARPPFDNPPSMIIHLPFSNSALLQGLNQGFTNAKRVNFCLGQLCGDATVKQPGNPSQ